MVFKRNDGVLLNFDEIRQRVKNHQLNTQGMIILNLQKIPMWPIKKKYKHMKRQSLGEIPSVSC